MQHALWYFDHSLSHHLFFFLTFIFFTSFLIFFFFTKLHHFWSLFSSHFFHTSLIWNIITAKKWGGGPSSLSPLFRGPRVWSSGCENTSKQVMIQYGHHFSDQWLRGYCTPNLKFACFVCYLKTINTFSKKNNEYTCIYHWNFSRPSSF